MCLRFPAPMCDSLQYLCAWLWQLESRRKAALKCRWGKCAFSAFHRGRDLSWPFHHHYRAEYLGQGHGQVRMAGFLLFWRTALFLKEQRWVCRTFEGCTLGFPQNKGLPGSKGLQCSVFIFSDFFFNFPVQTEAEGVPRGPQGWEDDYHVFGHVFPGEKCRLLHAGQPRLQSQALLVTLWKYNPVSY